tara:strand:- start:150 stop:449 length:300 start_codon:yes stop_codon:yes gene_type:complete
VVGQLQVCIVIEEFVTDVFVQHAFQIGKLLKLASSDAGSIELRIYVLDASIAFDIVFHLLVPKITDVSPLVIVYFAKRVQPGSVASSRSNVITRRIIIF